MRNPTIIAFLLCLPALMPIDALADWQYTKWGMSIDQAARASGGQLRVPNAQESSAQSVNGMPPRLVGTYRTAAFNFRCALYFLAPSLGLGMVKLAVIDYRQAPSIIESLRGLYGEAIESSRDRYGSKIRWRDDMHNNSIEVYDSPTGGLEINYTPLRSGSEKGL